MSLDLRRISGSRVRATSRALPLAIALAATVAVASAPLPAQPARPEPPTIGARDRQAIVDDLLRALDEVYVFPETARKMGEHVRQRLASGAYDGATVLPAFTEQLTQDLQSVSRDLHLRVFFDPEPPPAGAAGPTPEQQERFAAEQRRANYCFREAKLLTGNVGYLKLDCFTDAGAGGATAVAAMGFLAGADALVFDLRDNGGGSPSMIQLLTSYLLPAEPTHLNSFYVRRGDRTEQFWTHSYVPGRRLPDVPVFVLTSRRTFSAAEEFTYNLKNLKRATIVGETTGGGAHPVDLHRVAGYPVGMSLPFGRAVNPITGTNWEGTGIAPDVETAVADALAVAHERALVALAEKTSDPGHRLGLDIARRVVAGRRTPATVPAADLAALAGSYGPRVIHFEDGALHYQRGQGRKQRLTPIGEDHFLVGDLDDFLLRFERDASGRPVRVVGLYAEGREEPSERTGS